MREIITLDLKAHFDKREIEIMWEHFYCVRFLHPDQREYVLPGHYDRRGRRCAVWAIVSTDKNGEPVCTLRLPDDLNSLTA